MASDSPVQTTHKEPCSLAKPAGFSNRVCKRARARSNVPTPLVFTPNTNARFVPRFHTWSFPPPKGKSEKYDPEWASLLIQCDLRTGRRALEDVKFPDLKLAPRQALINCAQLSKLRTKDVRFKQRVQSHEPVLYSLKNIHGGQAEIQARKFNTLPPPAPNTQLGVHPYFLGRAALSKSKNLAHSTGPERPKLPSRSFPQTTPIVTLAAPAVIADNETNAYEVAKRRKASIHLPSQTQPINIDSSPEMDSPVRVFPDNQGQTPFPDDFDKMQTPRASRVIEGESKMFTEGTPETPEDTNARRRIEAAHVLSLLSTPDRAC